MNCCQRLPLSRKQYDAGGSQGRGYKTNNDVVQPVKLSSDMRQIERIHDYQQKGIIGETENESHQIAPHRKVERKFFQQIKPVLQSTHVVECHREKHNSSQEEIKQHVALTA